VFLLSNIIVIKKLLNDKIKNHIKKLIFIFISFFSIKMPLTNAERQKKHADKLKAQLGEEEYKKLIKIKNKNKYNKLKNISIIDKKDDVDEYVFVELKPLKKRINPLNKSKLNQETINKYLFTIKKIYFNYYNKEIIDDTDLLNVLQNKPYNLSKLVSLLSFVKNDLYNVIRNNHKDITILYAVITRIRNFAKTVRQLYPYIDQKQNIYNEKRCKKTPDDLIKQKMNALSFNIDNILSILNNPDLLLTDMEKLIIGLMLLFPTRRPVDYRKMLVVNFKPNIKDKNNYYFNNQFYFNITKNKDIQQFVIPEHLDLLIKNVIDKRQIDNNYLLLNENNKQFSSSGLSIFIMKTFQKVYNISISAVEIRRFYSTYLKNEVANGNLTEQEHRDISYKMNHSYEENKKYAY